MYFIAVDAPTAVKKPQPSASNHHSFCLREEISSIQRFLEGDRIDVKEDSAQLLVPLSFTIKSPVMVLHSLHVLHVFVNCILLLLDFYIIIH